MTDLTKKHIYVTMNYTVIKIIGGLGNQLFQYAFGRAVSQHNGTELVLDVSAFKDYKLHQLFLHKFNIKGRCVRNASKPLFCGLGFVSKLLRWLKNIPAVDSSFEEDGLAFNPEYFNMDSSGYFDGYWQSEKYFLSVKYELLNDITLRVPLSDRSVQLSSEMKKGNSVSIHIRRGDYVTNPQANKTHGVQGLDYYNNAVQYIQANVPAPIFYLFSDDNDWVRENFSWLKKAVVVDHVQKDANYEDLVLMSQCKHHIIANSSFSWWGAWLGESLETIVVCPKNWFAANSGLSSIDLIPARWVSI